MLFICSKYKRLNGEANFDSVDSRTHHWWSDTSFTRLQRPNPNSDPYPNPKINPNRKINRNPKSLEVKHLFNIILQKEPLKNSKKLKEIWKIRSSWGSNWPGSSQRSLHNLTTTPTDPAAQLSI